MCEESKRKFYLYNEYFSRQNLDRLLRAIEDLGFVGLVELNNKLSGLLVSYRSLCQAYFDLLCNSPSTSLARHLFKSTAN